MSQKIDLIFKRYVATFKRGDFLMSFFSAIVIFAISLVINYYAGNYATNSINNPVTDLILDHIRVYDVDGTFVYGALMLCFFIFLLCGYNPKKAPFIIKSISLFVVIRSFFIILTHIGPSPLKTAIDSTLISDFAFGGDLFFSGHTGLPFLMALIYWENRMLRTIFIAVSIMFGCVVLLGHIHYSIDVFAAFFITDGIYRIATLLFKKDFEEFHR